MRKSRSDSVEEAVAAFSDPAASVPLPDGVVLRDEDERVIWDQFTRTRARDLWRDFDLVLLAKVVRLEADIRRHQLTLDRSGPLIKNKRETLIENPLLRVVDTLQRQQLALIRSMSLTVTENDPRTLNASGQAEAEARKVMESNGAESLLAMPMRH